MPVSIFRSWRSVAGSSAYTSEFHTLTNTRGDANLSSSNAWCNACHRIIVDDRYMCLQCAEEGLRYQIDLCVDCRDQTPTSGALVHKRSHALARFNYVLHDYLKKAVYEDALEALDRVKRIATRLEDFSLESPITPKTATAFETRSSCKEDSISPPTCEECRRTVSLPCWYCASCYISASPTWIAITSD